MLISEKIKEIEALNTEAKELVEELKTTLSSEIQKEVQEALSNAENELKSLNEANFNEAFLQVQSQISSDLITQNTKLFNENLETLAKSIVTELDSNEVITQAVNIIKNTDGFTDNLEAIVLKDLQDNITEAKAQISQTTENTLKEITSIDIVSSTQEYLRNFLIENKEEVLSLQDFSTFKEMILDDKDIQNQILEYAKEAVNEKLNTQTLQAIVTQSLKDSAQDIFKEVLDLYEIRKQSFLANLLVGDIQQLSIIKTASLELENLTIKALLQQREEAYNEIKQQAQGGADTKAYAVI